MMRKTKAASSMMHPRFNYRIRVVFSKPEYLFLLIAILFGTVFVFSNPPGFGIDERAHFMRSYMVAHLNINPDRNTTTGTFGGNLPDNLAGFVAFSTTDLMLNKKYTNIFNRKDADISKYNRYSNETFSKNLINNEATNKQLLASLAYSPLGYIGFAASERLAELINLSIINTLYFARVFGLAAYIIAIFCAIRIAKNYKWLIVVIALLPTSLFQASTISLDPIVTASSILLFAALTRHWAKKNKPEKAWVNIIILCSLTALALTKIPYLGLLIIPVLLPKEVFWTRKLEIYWKTLWLIVPSITALAWIIFNAKVSKQLVILQTSGVADTSKQISVIVHEPLRFIEVLAYTYYQNADRMLSSLIGLIGDRQVGLTSAIMFILAFTALGLAGLFYKQLQTPKAIEQRQWLAIGSAIIAVILIMSTTLYLTFTPVREDMILGLQGRYFLPILPFILILLIKLSPLKIIEPKTKALIIALSSTILMLASTALLYLLANY